MSNRISIKPLHGAHTGMNIPCIWCGEMYGLVDWIEAEDHALGKKYILPIITCECEKILNKEELRNILPEIIFQKIFSEQLILC